MASFFVYRVRSACTECGESIVLEGPTLALTCQACQSPLELTADHWKGILGFRRFASEFNLVEGGTRGSSVSNGELRFLVKWGPSRPLCAGCGNPLDLSSAAPGTDGAIPCRCGASTTTFPPPPWLLAVEPDALQIFGAVKGGAPRGRESVEVREERNPISFTCPDCGANLKIGPQSPRVADCQYCKADLYLPDPLWRALHPVKKRVPWFVAYK